LGNVGFIEKRFCDRGFWRNHWSMPEFVLAMVVLGNSLSDTRKTDRDFGIIAEMERVVGWVKQNLNEKRLTKDEHKKWFDMVLNSKTAEEAGGGGRGGGMVYYKRQQSGGEHMIVAHAMKPQKHMVGRRRDGGGNRSQSSQSSIYSKDNDYDELECMMDDESSEEINCMMMGDIQDSPSSMEAPQIAGSVNRFKNAGATYEYTERQFYCTGQISIDYDKNVREKPTKFWLDALEYLLSYFRKPNQLRPHFLSPNFLDASGQIIDTLFIISFMDLPFQKAKPELTPQGDHSLKITPEKNLLLFLRSLKEFGSEKVDLEILLSQKFVDPENMHEYSEVTKQNTIKKVEEFVRGKKYCGRVAITNSSESYWDIRVITEIPQGAIPISPNEYSKSHYVRINPLSAQIVSYYFYFPQEGEFTTFRPIATMEGKLVASATGPRSVKVCEKFETKNVKSIEDILNTGSKADILKFMEDRNIHDPNVFQVSKIYWLMSDPTFFKQAFAI
jgi:hypothetical protein